MFKIVGRWREASFESVFVASRGEKRRKHGKNKLRNKKKEENKGKKKTYFYIGETNENGERETKVKGRRS